jgi:hypothetical protein
MGCADGTLVLVRPDEHIAAITSMKSAEAEKLYRKIVNVS